MSERYPGGFISLSYFPLQVPDAPTIGTATGSPSSASVSFTAPTNVGGSAITSYTVTSSPGGITATGTSSPITVTGLTNGTAYTFTVVATNSYGSGPSSSASNSVTPSFYTLYTWGVNDVSQLGQNQSEASLYGRSAPTQIGASNEWLDGSFGDNGFGVAIKSNNTLWSWGINSNGQLGIGTATGYRSSPVQVGSDTTWSKVSAGFVFTLAIKTNGTLWGWGRNNVGQLGDGTVVNKSSPTQVGALTTWFKISSGNFHALAVKTDGTLWAWGSGGSGQLGQGNTNSASSPVQVGSGTNWAAIAAGQDSSIAVKTDGTLWAWGRNNQGQLGFGNTTYYSSPKQVGALTNWSTCFASTTNANNTGAVKTDGTLWTWGGDNFYGALGHNNTVYLSSPTQVGALTTWSTGSFSRYTAHFIRTDGTLWGAGDNSQGAIGVGTTTPNYSSPVQIGSGTSWAVLPKGACNNYNGVMALSR